MLPIGPAAARGSGADLVISSGREGGGYHEIGRRVRNLLTNEHHYYVEVEPSRGSMENLERLADPESDLSKATDLKAEAGRSIAVGHENSGAAVTWAHMGQLEPGFQNTRPVYVDTVEALARIKAREHYSKLETAMLVQRPHVASPPLEIVLDSPDAFQILPILGGDLKSPALPNGEPVYTFEKVSIRKIAFDTICTRGLLLASKQKVDESVRSRLAEVLLESASYIAPKGE
jgi:hypothetical protein